MTLPGPLELSANLVMTLSIFLAAKNSVHTWWTGIIGSLLFGFLFYDAKLYADLSLQLFFIGTSIVGWQQWQKNQNGIPLAVTTCESSFLFWAIPASLICTLAYGSLLYYLTDAFAPYIDSAVLVLSILAQFLLVKRKFESWYFWILVNTISVPLFASRELYLTSFLYFVYWLNAFYGLWQWKKALNSK